jgi:hypothetical protein
MEYTTVSRDLIDRHLAVVAEAEDRGLPVIVQETNSVWQFHEIALSALEGMLAEAHL